MISQREARRLKKRVEVLEQTLRDFRRPTLSASEGYPGGVHIATEAGVEQKTAACVQTAMRLGHVVLAAVGDGSTTMRFYALPAPSTPE